MTFYVYLWLREDGTPYYVGKGRDDRGRAYRAFRKGCPPRERIRVFPRLSEGDALATERTLISALGRKDNGTGILRNLTDGGEGAVGVKRSLEWRKRLSERSRGNTWGHLQKGSKRRPLSPEHRQKIALGNTGNTPTEETRRKLRAAARTPHRLAILAENRTPQHQLAASRAAALARQKRAALRKLNNGQ